MARKMPHNAKTLQTEIRRQFGSAGTSRFLRSLPDFRVEQKVPQRFADLLAELDRAESAPRNGRGADG